MIKDGSSLTAWILLAAQIYCSLQTLPPPLFFTRFLFCFHSLFLTVSLTFISLRFQDHFFPACSYHFSPVFCSYPLQLLSISLFCHFSTPPLFLSFLWEGGMSYMASYRQFLQDLEEKRGWCPLQPCHLLFTSS